MHNHVVAFVVAILAAGPVSATDKTDVMSIIHEWVDGFNRGDTQKAIATCADQTSLIDDFPPHEWHGPGACAKWFSDFQTMSQSFGTSKHVITMEKRSHIETTAHLAYVVVRTTLSFHRKGKLIRDKGILTVTLQKAASSWRITGWVWSDQ